MANLDSIFKSRDITLTTKVHLVKAIVFPVIFPYYSLELYIQMGISFLFSFAFCFSSIHSYL